MAKKEKIKEKTKEKIHEKTEDYLKIQKLDVISHIEDLKIAAQNYKMSGKLEEAIICADQIIRIAVQYDMLFYMKEQEDFINNIARNIQKEQLITQIKEYASWIINQYDKLVASGAIIQAHEIVESFKQRYKEFPFFESVPEVQEIIKKDSREWIKYTITYQ